MAKRKVRTAILISGRGSNMVSLIKAGQDPDYPADFVLVVSNRPDAEGLNKAELMGIATKALDHTEFSGRKAFEQALHAILKDANIDLICCAGFMRILSPWFVKHWPNRILNIHPSLLPKYKGLNTHQRALDAGDTKHGCTVHYVTEELDGGDIIAQSKVRIDKIDTIETLSNKVIEKEHILYPTAIEKVIFAIMQRN